MVANAAREIDNAILEEIKIEILNNTILIRSSNPHGFYKVSLQRGVLPDYLRGQYTSIKAAEDGVMKWVNEKNKQIAV